MKFDANLRPLRLADVSTEAARYEEMGFDGVWSFESAHDPFLPLAQAALNTTKLGIGTNIAVALLVVRLQRRKRPGIYRQLAAGGWYWV